MSEKLFLDAMEFIGDDLIESVGSIREQKKAKRLVPWTRYAATAASLMIVVGVVWLISRTLPPMSESDLASGDRIDKADVAETQAVSDNLYGETNAASPDIDCAEATSETALNCAEFDLSNVKKINITSMYSGKKMTVTSKDDVSTLVSMVGKIKGSSPISSKGYYGGSYSLEFYGFDETEPILKFGLFQTAGVSYFVYGSFETANSVDYPGMYVIDDSLMKKLNIICATLLDEIDFIESNH